MTDFEKIMKYAGGEGDLVHNQMVFDQLLSAIKRGNVVPFVGAGMSVPVYPQWGETLTTISKMLNGTMRKEFSAILKRKDDPNAYTDAAEYLARKLSSDYIIEALKWIGNEKKLENPAYKGLAAHILPYLFPNTPIVTTNFERTLEHIYRDHNKPFDRVIGPANIDGVIQANYHCLTKLHGDIGVETTTEDIVFTKKSYNTAYRKDSELVKTLSMLYQGKTMLFLGSSLKYDRTLNVLKKISSTKRVHHYAILPSAKKDIVQNIEFFRARGINVILYNSKDSLGHGAVRIILEELLRKTDPDSFHGYKQTKPTEIDQDANPFIYTTMASKFFGRDEEMKALQEFVESAPKFRWWGIVGDGGLGKSRLSLELENELKKENWQVIRVEECQYNSLQQFNSVLEKNEQNLIIADYGLCHAEKLGIWMRSLINWQFGKVRILIIERDNDKNQISNTIIKQGGGLKETLWRDFMKLRPISDDNLKRIINSYADYRKRKLTKEQVSMLLYTLKQIDEKDVRPLFAIFLTDSFCDGHDPMDLDRKGVLKEVLTREERIIKHNTTNASDDVTDRNIDTALRKAIDPLRLIATFSGGISIDTVVEKYVTQWQSFSDAFPSCENDSNELVILLEKMGICKNGILEALRPDLLGEFFVLSHLDEILPILFCEDWLSDFEKLRFIRKLISDYGDEIKDYPLFVNFILEAEPHSTEMTIELSHMLVSISEYIPEYGNKSINKLKDLTEQHKDDSFLLLIYSHGLISLLEHQEYTKKLETVDKLQRLYEAETKEPYKRELAYAYSIGLDYLSEGQGSIEFGETTDILRTLAECYPDAIGIIRQYAIGLRMLSYKQDLWDAEDTMKKLRVLIDQHPGNIFFVHEYLHGLVELMERQSVEQEKKAVDEIKEFAKQYPHDIFIKEVYASGLEDLSRYQKTEEAEKTISNLRILTEQRPDDATLLVAYVKGLINQKKYDILDTEINKLKECVEQHRLPSEQAYSFTYALAGIVSLLQLECEERIVQNDEKENKPMEGKKQVVFSIDQIYEYAKDVLEILRIHSERNKEIAVITKIYRNIKQESFFSDK